MTCSQRLCVQVRFGNNRRPTACSRTNPRASDKSLDFYTKTLGMEIDYTDKAGWAQFKSGEDVYTNAVAAGVSAIAYRIASVPGHFHPCRIGLLSERSCPANKGLRKVSANLKT
jgi:hypothetical protein